MNSSFSSSASRHLRAAALCLSDCPDTAGYLLGYVAECSVKAVIEIAGIQIRRHLNQISAKHLLLARISAWQLADTQSISMLTWIASETTGRRNCDTLRLAHSRISKSQSFMNKQRAFFEIRYTQWYSTD